MLAGCDLAFQLERPTCGSTVDEDGDGTPDECDTCPGAADETNRDSDDDGVGDVCDPEPRAACQRRALFDGFAADVASPRLATEEWVIGEGDAVQGDVQASLALLQYPVASRPRVQAAISVDELGAAAIRYVEIGSALEVGMARSFEAGFTCRFLANNDQLQIRILAHPSMQLANEPYVGDMVFTNMLLTLDTTSPTLACDVTKTNGAGSATAVPTTAMDLGLVAVRVQLAAVRVHWIDIIEPTCL